MPNSYTGNASNGFKSTISYPADGDLANEASTDPLESLLDNDVVLMAQLSDASSGLPALNGRVDALAALNFPYDSFPPILAAASASGHPYEIYDYDFSVADQTYYALVNDNSESTTWFYYSTDLHEWTKDSIAITATPDIITNICAGAAPGLTAGALRWNSSNLEIIKYRKGTGATQTATALAGSASILSNPHGSAFINGVYCWGLFDAVNNACLVTSSTLTSVSRQAFGTVGDMNHIRGPMVMATNANYANAATILVAIGNAPCGAPGPIVQNNSFFLTTTDGITFTERVFPAVNPGNETFGGVCWNDDQHLFFAASTDMTTGAFNIYKSADGLSWSLVKTIASPGFTPFVWRCAGIASVNTTILLSLYIQTGGTGGKHYFTYSTDLGATWIQNVKNAYLPAGNDANRLTGKLRGDTGQFSFGNSNHVMGAIVIGRQGQATT